MAIIRARGRMQRLAELDAASEDVLVEVLRALEEQLWMVRAQLPVRGA
jgi:DNA-binding ferritin-like protein